MVLCLVFYILGIHNILKFESVKKNLILNFSLVHGVQLMELYLFGPFLRAVVADRIGVTAITAGTGANLLDSNFFLFCFNFFQLCGDQRLLVTLPLGLIFCNSCFPTLFIFFYTFRKTIKFRQQHDGHLERWLDDEIDEAHL